MDPTWSVEDEAFRREVRSWLTEHLVGEFERIGPSYDLERNAASRREWERELGRGGWLGISWPKRFAGRELPLTQQVIFAEEYARAGAPRRAVFGEGLLGPTLMVWGTDEQQERFLPPILHGEELWCQGFSEPEAGSDLANLKTRATRVGDEWSITGQKTWTSQAVEADWIFLLARTGHGERPHDGITFLLCPMDQPGIEVRPIRQIGGSSEFNEVFLDDARTPVSLTVGPEGRGFKVAMSTLGLERGTAFAGERVRFETEFWEHAQTAREVEGGSVTRTTLARLLVDLELMRLNARRSLTAHLAGDQPGAEGSAAKLAWSSWHQRLTEFGMDVRGLGGLVLGHSDGLRAHQETFLFSRAHTIYAGTSEIQRNILAEQVLGLPREPAALR